MSYYIKIHRWAGQNPEDAIARFAKVFHFSTAQAAEVLQSARQGQSWQFDKTISLAQSEKARLYLQSLGYEVELIQVVSPPEPLRANTAPTETLAAPMETLPRKSPLDFLKKINLGGSGVGKKSLLSPKADGENAKPPQKSFLDFLKKKKAVIPTPEIATPVAETAEPQAYRKKSNLAPVVVVFVLFAAASLLPFYFGIRAEAILYELMPRMFQKGAVINLKSYERGWLSSRAEYVIKTPAGGVYQATSGIEHGPFSLAELLDGNINYFQARIESKIPLVTLKSADGSQASDPIELLVMKGYFIKKGNMYKMDLLVLDEGLKVNGKLIPSVRE